MTRAYHPQIVKGDYQSTPPTVPDGSAENLQIDDRANLAVTSWDYNGSTVDRHRNNVDATALASAARTATTDSADITNYNARGVMLFLDVTAVTGTPSITVRIQSKDPVTGEYSNLLIGAAVTATTSEPVAYILYPGAQDTTGQLVGVSDVALPRTWRVEVVHADADSITYTVGYSLIV